MPRSASKLLRVWVFACAACAATATPAQTNGWKVQVTPFSQVFPALDLSQGASHTQSREADGAQVVGSGNGLIAVQLTADRDHEAVHLEIGSASWLAESAQLDVVLPHAGANYELRPTLAWDARKLALQTNPIATVLRFSLRRDGHAAVEQDIEVSLRPLNEALYFVRDGRDTVDLSWIFAAFVNEGDAVVDEVLELGTQSAIVDGFSGYSGGSQEDVERQAWAIWHALSARGIRYSGADPGVDRGPRVFSQRVRFLADIWNDRSANCIDGSALLASALQRIGLRSFLVLVPGHALVGFYADADSRRAIYLETTLLGTRVAPLRVLPDYAQVVDTSAATRASLASFEAALRAGAARHARIADKLDGQHRPDYALIDIQAARAFGIRPIAISTMPIEATR